MTATRTGVALARGPHHLKLLGHPDRGDLRTIAAGRPIQVRPHHLDLALTASKPHPRDVVGLGESPHTLPERAPICSNTGVTRSACPDAHAGNTPPRQGLQLCTKPDKYSRSRHDRSNTVCSSSTSLTVTHHNSLTAAPWSPPRNHAYGPENDPPALSYQAHHPLGGPRRSLSGWLVSNGLCVAASRDRPMRRCRI